MKKFSPTEWTVCGLLTLAGFLSFGTLAAQAVRTMQPPPLLIVRGGTGDGSLLLSKAGELNYFSVFVPSNSGITNLEFRAYTARATNVSNVPRIATQGLVAGSNFVTTNSTYFTGNQTRGLQDGWNDIPYLMDTNSVTKDFLMLVLPYESGSNAPLQGGVLISVDAVPYQE
jgi:hypothetical protein